MQKFRSDLLTITPGFFIYFAAAVLLLPLKWVCAWFIASVIHELCHYFALRLCGVQVFSVRISCSGAIMETESMHPRQEILCALAGPLGGLLLLIILRIFPAIAICAFVQSVFNLLPVYPFDGGRALRAIIRVCRRKTPCKQTKVIVQ